MPKGLALGGATGLLGQSLVKIMDKYGWETAVLGREDGNLLDRDFLCAKIDEISPDVIFNTIAWTQVDAAEDQPEKAQEINCAFPKLLADILVSRKNIHLLHYSTDFVFSGQPRDDYWKESDEPAPVSVYGSSKLAGEKAVMERLADRACIMRTAWLFGPGRKNFVQTILDAARDRETLSVVDDQKGSPTYAPDLSEWSVALAEARKIGVWHAVNSGHASWCELAEEALHLANSPCKAQPIRSSQWPQKAERPKNSIMSNNKLTKFLGKRPRPWPQALREYIFREYLPGQRMRP